MDKRKKGDKEREKKTNEESIKKKSDEEREKKTDENLKEEMKPESIMKMSIADQIMKPEELQPVLFQTKEKR